MPSGSCAASKSQELIACAQGLVAQEIFACGIGGQGTSDMAVMMSLRNGLFCAFANYPNSAFN